MDKKDLRYFWEGLTGTVTEFYGELYDSLVAKGKRQLGDDSAAQTPHISDIIRRMREKEAMQELLSRGKRGR